MYLGWGTLFKEADEGSYILNNVKLKVYSKSVCEGNPNIPHNWNAQVCAGSTYFFKLKICIYCY